MNPEFLSFAIRVYQVDAECREELSRGLITSENDYTSSLMCALRHLLNQGRVFHISKRLPGDREQLFGCDAMIVLYVGAWAKVCLFEAKWQRRLIGPRNRWDTRRNKHRESRFTSQLLRQTAWAHTAAIWEMFYNEERPGVSASPFDKFGADCIWHDQAMKYYRTAINQNTIRWTDQNIEEMLKNRPPVYSRNLMHMIYQVLRCRRGEPLAVNRRVVRVESTDGQRVSIPIPEPDVREHVALIDDGNGSRRLHEFMEEYGLSNFLYWSPSGRYPV